MGSGVRLRGAGAGRRRRGARAPRRRARSGTNLGNWLKLAFFKTAAFADEADAAEKLGEWLREHNARRRTRSPARRPRSCWPRSGSACGRSSCSRAISRCAFPVLVGPRAVGRLRRPVVRDAARGGGPVGVLQPLSRSRRIAAGRYEATHPRRRPSMSYVPPEIDASIAAADANGGTTIARARGVPPDRARFRSRRRSRRQRLRLRAVGAGVFDYCFFFR